MKQNIFLFIATIVQLRFGQVFLLFMENVDFV